MIFPENQSEQLKQEVFKNPPKEYRGLPFWSWNCKLKKEVIEEQLDIFDEMGFGGVVIHPRDGLDTEYLGGEYMEMVRFTVEKCRQKGLLCWLYDDDRFPSGAAGGIVTKNPKYRARQLRLTKSDPGQGFVSSREEFEDAVREGEIPSGYYLTSYFLEIKDKRLVSFRRTDNREEAMAALEKGENVRMAYLELQEESEWFEGQTYVDTMNPEAVDEFIRVTHKQYKHALGTDFGTAASAIFTDEPRLGKQTTLDTAESGEDVWVPYNEYFAEQFFKKYKEDALDVVPEFVWERQDGDYRRRWRYREMAKECFSQVFMDRISAWCKENGILMTGHILGETPLSAETATVGDAMRTYKNMDIPGVDMLIDARELNTVKQAVSVAVQYGREAVMSELYGVTNWDCTFKTYKLQGDWQAALGITIRIPHLSHMSLGGEAKRDWPGSIFYQAPWYREFCWLEDHFARLNTVLARGKRQTRIAVVNPVESMWVSFGTDDLTKNTRKQLDQDFTNLAEWLLYSCLDFDFLSESLLVEECGEYEDKRRDETAAKEPWGESGSSVAVQGETSRLIVGRVSYETVIVPGCITIRDTTLNILTKFAQKGGKVILMGNSPRLVCGKPSDSVSGLESISVAIPKEKDRLLEELENFRDVEIDWENGTKSENLFYQLREDGISKWLFIAHANEREHGEEHYVVKVKGEFVPMLYDTMSGSVEKIPFCTEKGWTVIRWSCYSEDSLLLKLEYMEGHSRFAGGNKVAGDRKSNSIRPGADTRMLSRNERLEDWKETVSAYEENDLQKGKLTSGFRAGKEQYKTIQTLHNVHEIRRTEPNVLLLDYAKASLNGEDFWEREEILRADNHVRRTLGFKEREGRDRQPWATKEGESHPVTLLYEFYSDVCIPIQLGIEHPEKCRIFLNGEEADNQASGWYVDKDIKVVGLPPLKKGLNQLKVELLYNRKSYLENMYLLGDFDVERKAGGWTVTASKNCKDYGDVTLQGMPFYTGNLEYSFEVEIQKEGKYFVRIPDFRAPLLGITVDGEKKDCIAFAPHRAALGMLGAGKHSVMVTLYGNRFNAFGMLHNANENYVWYGNDSYRTTGENWTDDYMLRPMGILSSVIVEEMV